MTLPKHDFMISWFSAWNFFLILLVHWTYFSFSAQRQFRHHPLPSIIGDCPLAPSPLWYLAFLYILIDHRCSFLYAFLHLPYYQPNGVCSVASVPLRHITMPFLCPGTHSKCHMFTTKRVSLFPGIYNTDKLSTKKQRKTNKKKKEKKIRYTLTCTLQTQFHSDSSAYYWSSKVSHTRRVRLKDSCFPFPEDWLH